MECLNCDFHYNNVRLFAELTGKVLKEVVVDKEKEWITFYTTGGEKYILKHNQDCCEDVRLEDICGDFNDLVGTTILLAEEISNNEDLDEGSYVSLTWTFYKISTIKGSVTIRWYGKSNGCYSEKAELYFIQSKCYEKDKHCGYIYGNENVNSNNTLIYKI